MILKLSDISDDSGLLSLEHPRKKRTIETNDKNFIFFILVFFFTKLFPLNE